MAVLTSLAEPIVHIMTGFGPSPFDRVLRRVVATARDRRALHQVIIALTKDGLPCHPPSDADVEVHWLRLGGFWHFPAAIVALASVLRRICPKVVMTWNYQADLIGTLAAIAGGVRLNRLVWNLSFSTPNLSESSRSKTRLMLQVLAWLSYFPCVIIARSRSNRREHERLGFRARHWVWPPNDTARSINRFIAHAASSGNFVSRIEHALPRLKKESVAKLCRFSLMNTTFIAVTGSCGKSTTVKLAVDMLKTRGSCYRGGHGNIPGSSAKTLLAIPQSSKFCIREISAHRPGVIAEHVRVLRPHIAIVTTIGSDHYKNFRGLEATATEKGKLVESLPRRGTAILNADDPHVRAMADRTRARVLTFGRSPDAEVRASEVSSVWPDRLKLTVSYRQESVRVHTRLVGEHWTTSVLAAIACGIVCGVDFKTCGKVIETVKPVFGRYSIHGKSSGPVYVLDTWKAPLWTIASALTFVTQARACRKTIVFGTISDFAGSSSPKYRRIAREALAVADRVVFVGPNASHVTKASVPADLRERLFTFESSYQASTFLAAEIRPEELIFIKASGADHLERIMLSQLAQVTCWREQCKAAASFCTGCRNYRKPQKQKLTVVRGLRSTAH
jgi:UDP-N-acetylmuramoyl-tripeptide--D-alanyl-D-alanine ligase